MQVHAAATFDVKSWDESAVDDEPELAKVTRAEVTKAYAGDMAGSSTTVWLMAYAEDGSATFVGLERFTGRIGDRDGSLVLQHLGGSYANGAAKARLVVVPGSNSGALESATGDGDFLANPNGSVTLDLTLD
jgi:uncharacterized protein YigE (DUF2233 family)